MIGRAWSAGVSKAELGAAACSAATRRDPTSSRHVSATTSSSGAFCPKAVVAVL